MSKEVLRIILKTSFFCPGHRVEKVSSIATAMRIITHTLPQSKTTTVVFTSSIKPKNESILRSYGAMTNMNHGSGFTPSSPE